MKTEQKTHRMTMYQRAAIVLFALCLVIGIGASIFAADSGERKLLNGSFEEGPSLTKDYDQPDQSKVPAWNTTAKEGKIELFRTCKNVYTKNNATLAPTDGLIAAELNADEESTLYQNVKTTQSSVYEWGLDHGVRNGTDVMALVIGPKQSINPSKPSKDGRDQFMQMADWLSTLNFIPARGDENRWAQWVQDHPYANGPVKFIVYSKKFAENGAFADNAGNNPFSLTPSTIYSEEWNLWIIADVKAVENNYLKWYSYGSNAEGSAGSGNGSGSTTIDTSKYYLYTVPARQTETLFGFVSVGFVTDGTADSAKATTYGNFIDRINFQLYHPLSGSSTAHGSAIIGGSDGTTEGEGASDGHKVTVNNKLATYITDGEPLKVQAIVKKSDADVGCEYVGLYYTNLDKDGNPVTTFLQLSGNEIKDTGSLTNEEKAGKWLKSTNSNGDIIYTYYLENLTTPVDLHFVFIKNPTITYDPNGGKGYVVEREYNTSEAANVYSFKPATETNTNTNTNTIKFISPYISHAAEGQNDGWKFMGWLLTGDTIDSIPSDIVQVNADQLGSLLLPAVHTVACDYLLGEEEEQPAAQYFKIYDGVVKLADKQIKNANEQLSGVTWNDNGETIAYANVHKGLTMVAQWRWLQAFIPQVDKGDGETFTNSKKGGTVEIDNVSGSDNYNAAYNDNGGKSYHATTDETITVKATANTGYTFEGWYDAKGKLITTNPTYSYTETKESVNTYYARFSNSVTQTYIRQVKNGDTWENTTDDKIGTLGRYSYTDALGTAISSTAQEGTGYKFMGWYDADGNKVPDSMLINDGATISYTTTESATYYARFQTAYTVKFAAQTKQANGSFKTNTIGGNVSVASVKEVDGADASSKATANTNYKFLGWYDKNGNQLSANVTYTPVITAATNGVTYYARFEVDYKPTIDNKAYLSFVAESPETEIPSVFDDRDAGTNRNGDYGYADEFGNSVSTGFKYSLNTMTDVETIQITVTVPDSAYVKVFEGSSFTGNGLSILTDSDGVKYKKGSIQQIHEATTIVYYWDASGLEANTTYGFIIDELYAPGATATITVNGKDGKKVTDQNGVVNTAASNYRENSHYPK